MPPSDPIYLDYNATTPLLAEVVEAMLPYLREHAGNPSSTHVFGQRARAAVDAARAQVAALLGCDSDEVIFTSGGTEANNLAIRGVTAALGRKGRLVIGRAASLNSAMSGVISAVSGDPRPASPIAAERTVSCRITAPAARISGPPRPSMISVGSSSLRLRTRCAAC